MSATVTFSFLLRSRGHLHLVPVGNERSLRGALCTCCAREVLLLVVGEGGVRSADGDGEQEHVFGVRLAGQGGEQILCFLG